MNNSDYQAETENWSGDSMTRRRFKAGDSLWLALALLLHLALLLVVWQKPQKATQTQKSITVILDIQSKTEPQLDQPVFIQPVLIQPARTQETEPQPAPPQPQDTRQLKPEQLAAKKSSTPINTAQLLLNVSEIKFPPQEADNKQKLGDFEPQPLPANWLPRTGLEDNMFNGRMISGQAEIVDQWTSADGGYNVFVKSASGQGFCGKAEPWSAMNPLLEPVIMWRLCD